jgi:hypothetical protein
MPHVGSSEPSPPKEKPRAAHAVEHRSRVTAPCWRPRRGRLAGGTGRLHRARLGPLPHDPRWGVEDTINWDGPPRHARSRILSTATQLVNGEEREEHHADALPGTPTMNKQSDMPWRSNVDLVTGVWKLINQEAEKPIRALSRQSMAGTVCVRKGPPAAGLSAPSSPVLQATALNAGANTTRSLTVAGRPL